MEKTELTFDELASLRKECKEKIDIAEALIRLQQSSDFNLVFGKNYVLEESSRLVSLLADASLNIGGKKAEYREDIQERMIGIARFSEYIRNVLNIADQADKTLKNLLEAEEQFYNKDLEPSLSIDEEY